MNSKQINDAQLTYTEAGSSDNQTIVLIHGFCGSTLYWEKVVPALAKQYHVLTVNLRGHGDTLFNNQAFEIEDLAEDIHVLINENKKDKVCVFGHSLGGYVTLAFAEKYPHLLAGFGLIHSTAYPDTEEGKNGRKKAVEKIQNQGIQVFVDGLIPNLFSDETIANNQKIIENAKQIGYGTNQIAAMETLLAMRNRPDRNQVIKDSKVPVLLVKGLADKVVALDRVTDVEDSFITEIRLPTGHMSMYEKPAQLVEALTMFMENDVAK